MPPPQVDPTDPRVRQLAYSMYRDMLGACHAKSTEMVGKAPQGKAVVEDRGVVEQIISMAQQKTSASGKEAPPAHTSVFNSTPALSNGSSAIQSHGTPFNGVLKPINGDVTSNGVTKTNGLSVTTEVADSCGRNGAITGVNGPSNGINGTMHKAGIPPPPPPPPTGRMGPSQLQIQTAPREAPAAIQNVMATKDKKPFSYLPAGGIDFSEIKTQAAAINKPLSTANAEQVTPATSMNKSPPTAPPQPASVASNQQVSPPGARWQPAQSHMVPRPSQPPTAAHAAGSANPEKGASPGSKPGSVGSAWEQNLARNRTAAPPSPPYVEKVAPPATTGKKPLGSTGETAPSAAAVAIAKNPPWRVSRKQSSQDNSVPASTSAQARGQLYIPPVAKPEPVAEALPSPPVLIHSKAPTWQHSPEAKATVKSPLVANTSENAAQWRQARQLQKQASHPSGMSTVDGPSNTSSLPPQQTGPNSERTIQLQLVEGPDGQPCLSIGGQRVPITADGVQLPVGLIMPDVERNRLLQAVAQRQTTSPNRPPTRPLPSAAARPRDLPHDVPKDSVGDPIPSMRSLQLSDEDRRLVAAFHEQAVGEAPQFLHKESDPRYRGAHIPSKTFRILQQATGELGVSGEAGPPSRIGGPGQGRAVLVNMQPGKPGGSGGAARQNETQSVQRPNPAASRSFRRLQQMTAEQQELAGLGLLDDGSDNSRPLRASLLTESPSSGTIVAATGGLKRSYSRTKTSRLSRFLADSTTPSCRTASFSSVSSGFEDLGSGGSSKGTSEASDFEDEDGGRRGQQILNTLTAKRGSDSSDDTVIERRSSTLTLSSSPRRGSTCTSPLRASTIVDSLKQTKASTLDACKTSSGTSSSSATEEFSDVFENIWNVDSNSSKNAGANDGEHLFVANREKLFDTWLANLEKRNKRLSAVEPLAPVSPIVEEPSEVNILGRYLIDHLNMQQSGRSDATEKYATTDIQENSKAAVNEANDSTRLLRSESADSRVQNMHRDVGNQERNHKERATRSLSKTKDSEINRPLVSHHPISLHCQNIEYPETCKLTSSILNVSSVDTFGEVSNNNSGDTLKQLSKQVITENGEKVQVKMRRKKTKVKEVSEYEHAFQGNVAKKIKKLSKGFGADHPLAETENSSPLPKKRSPSKKMSVEDTNPHSCDNSLGISSAHPAEEVVTVKLKLRPTMQSQQSIRNDSVSPQRSTICIPTSHLNKVDFPDKSKKEQQKNRRGLVTFETALRFFQETSTASSDPESSELASESSGTSSSNGRQQVSSPSMRPQSCIETSSGAYTEVTLHFNGKPSPSQYMSRRSSEDETKGGTGGSSREKTYSVVKQRLSDVPERISAEIDEAMTLPLPSKATSPPKVVDCIPKIAVIPKAKLLPKVVPISSSNSRASADRESISSVTVSLPKSLSPSCSSSSDYHIQSSSSSSNSIASSEEFARTSPLPDCKESLVLPGEEKILTGKEAEPRLHTEKSPKSTKKKLQEALSAATSKKCKSKESSKILIPKKIASVSSTLRSPKPFRKEPPENESVPAVHSTSKSKETSACSYASTTPLTQDVQREELYKLPFSTDISPSTSSSKYPDAPMQSKSANSSKLPISPGELASAAAKLSVMRRKKTPSSDDGGSKLPLRRSANVDFAQSPKDAKLIAGGRVPRVAQKDSVLSELKAIVEGTVAKVKRPTASKSGIFRRLQCEFGTTSDVDIPAKVKEESRNEQKESSSGILVAASTSPRRELPSTGSISTESGFSEDEDLANSSGSIVVTSVGTERS